MQIGFNPSQYQPFAGYELLAAGRYPVVITDMVAERTKDQSGGLLKVEFTIAQGHPAAGRKVYTRLNLWNQNPESVAIAHKQLTALCYACGHYRELADTDQIKNIPMAVELTNDGKYNNVSLFLDAQGNTPGAQAQGGSPTQGAPGQAGMPAFGQPQQQQQPQGFQQPQQFPQGGFPQQGQAQPQQPAQQFQQPQQGQPAPFGAGPGNPFQPAQQQQPQQNGFPGGAPAGFVQPQAQQPFNPGQGFQQQPQQGQPQGFFPQG